ncbi:head completion/stabilization protein [Escherichia coli]|uniref:head completion/stabilization protein n=1 Tax=Escherichia coli TaxID=562 RepID=UPI003D9C7DC7
MRLEQNRRPPPVCVRLSSSGMAETNAELYEYREQKIAAGFTRLGGRSRRTTSTGKSIKVFYYERAVCAMATRVAL